MLSNSSLTYIFAMNIQMKVRSLEKVRLFIKRGQIRSVTVLLVYALGLKSYLPHFLKLADNIISMWKLSGRKALISYLKECVRATVQFVAGQQYIRNSIPVKLNRVGLPKIIPGPLRIRIASLKGGVETSESILILRAVLSILQVYRTIKVPGLVAEISTVTGPYTGTITSLLSEVKVVSRWFPTLKVRKGGSWSISETSGPNSPLSTWGSVADVFAFAWDHNTFANLVKYGIKRRAYAHVVWVMFLYLIIESFYGLSVFTLFHVSVSYPQASPLMFLIALLMYLKVFFGIKWVTGRLATFEEGGGKIRIVAIFDAWSQWLLKPLHDGIFDLFSQLSTDGTHNQIKPLNSLMDYIRLGHPAYSFDLTAATDRIPLWLQVEVLESFGFRESKDWAALIADRSFRITNGFKDSINKSICADLDPIITRGRGVDIRYSVGQPMGAYSSWAVMALTHHVLVQIAALRVGHKGYFIHYALLGDDIVIANHEVAMMYLQVMKEIGVGVNRLKSIESEAGVVEFAKRWVHPHLGEFSPIGAKLILAVIKNVTLFPALFTEMAQKGFTLYPSSIVAVLQGLLKIRGRKVPSPEFLRDIEVAALAPNGILDKGHMISEWMNLWILRITGSTVDDFVIRNMLIKPFWDKQIATVDARPAENLSFFLTKFWRTPMIRGRLTAWLLQPMLIVSPAFWLYLRDLIEAFNANHSFSLQMYGIVHAADPNARKHISLSMLPEHSWNRSIDWRERGVVAKHTLALKEYGDALRRVTIPEQATPILFLSDGVERDFTKKSLQATE